MNQLGESNGVCIWIGRIDRQCTNERAPMLDEKLTLAKVSSLPLSTLGKLQAAVASSKTNRSAGTSTRLSNKKRSLQFWILKNTIELYVRVTLLASPGYPLANRLHLSV